MHLGGEQVCDLIGGGDGPDVLGACVFVLLEPVDGAAGRVDGQLHVEVDNSVGGLQRCVDGRHDLKSKSVAN